MDLTNKAFKSALLSTCSAAKRMGKSATLVFSRATGSYQVEDKDAFIPRQDLKDITEVTYTGDGLVVTHREQEFSKPTQIVLSVADSRVGSLKPYGILEDGTHVL